MSEFEEIVKGIQTKTLQKLLLIWYNVFHDMKNSPIAPKIYERALKKQPTVSFTRRNIAYEMEPGDVASFLKISKRRARDYIKVFRKIYSEVEG
jgi:hypothetical protein